MNANIFSCTVPPLLVLETQIIHPELLQSLCTTHWDPFFWQTYVRGQKRLRARTDVYARTHLSARAEVSARARRRVRVRTDVCARTHPSARALTRLRAPLPVCARAHPSARALRQHGFWFDTSTSLKLPTVKKKW